MKNELFFPDDLQLSEGQRITFREARPDDAQKLIWFLQQAAFESEFLSGEPDEYEMSVEEEVEWIQLHLNHPNAFLLTAWEAENLIGIINYAPHNRRRMGHTGEFGMAVLKKWWGKRIGTALLGSLLSWARANPGVEKVILNVHSTNERGIHLYKKLGFVEEGRMKRYIKFSDGRYIDNVVMGLFV